MNAPSFVLRSVFVGLNYRALTDAVSRDRSPSFSVSPIFRTDTGRFMRPPLALSWLLSHSSPSSFRAILSAPLMSALITVPSAVRYKPRFSRLPENFLLTDCSSRLRSSVWHRNRRHCPGRCNFFDLRVERLCFTATDLERLKADLFTAREIETMIFDLVAVETDDKGTITFLVAGQIGMGFELLGILPIEDVRGLLLSICCESRACARDFS